MEAVKFRGSNVVYAENQPEYVPLPAMQLGDPFGTVITCWQMTDEELEQVKKTGRVYLKMLTFNQPLQPILLMADLGDDIQLIPEKTEG